MDRRLVNPSRSHPSLAHKSTQDWDDDLQWLVKTMQKTKELRNASVPISRLLPDDMLLAIFLEAQCMIWDTMAGSNRWLFLSLVCRRWRSVALDYQHFWRRIYVGHSTSQDCVNQLLLRSGTVPLVVVLRRSTIWRNLPVWDHVKRIEHLTLEICPDGAALGVPLTDAPLLESFTIVARQMPVYLDPFDHAYSRPLPPFALVPLRTLPKLAKVAIEKWNQPFSALKDVLPPCLQELTVKLKEVPSYAELESTLSGLRYLELLGLHTGRTESRSRSGPNTISLPRMRTIRLTGSTSACIFFVSVLAAPATAAFYVAPIETTRLRDYTSLCDAIRNRSYGHAKYPFDVTWRIEQIGEWITWAIWLGYSPENGRLAVSSFQPTVEVTLPNDSFELFCTPLAQQKVRTLVIMGLNINEGPRWTKFFTSLEGVEKVWLVNAHLNAYVHRWLGRRVIQWEPSTLLFPDLKHLQFSQTCFDTEASASDRGALLGDESCAVSWKWLKSYLAQRKEEEIGLSELVLEDAYGLQREHMHELRESVTRVVLNGVQFVFEQQMEPMGSHPAAAQTTEDRSSGVSESVLA